MAGPTRDPGRSLEEEAGRGDPNTTPGTETRRGSSDAEGAPRQGGGPPEEERSLPEHRRMSVRRDLGEGDLDR